MRVHPSVLERDGKKFYYVDMGSETHGRRSFRLWISSKLVQRDEKGREYVEIAGKDKRIFVTEKGNYVLKPEKGWNVFAVGWECGYRGSSSFEVLGRLKDEVVLPYYNYRSPRGSLGISEYGLVSTQRDRIAVKLTRSGRTYGAPKEKVVEHYIDEQGKARERELPAACIEDEELATVLEEDSEQEKDFELGM